MAFLKTNPRNIKKKIIEENQHSLENKNQRNNLNTSDTK